LLQRRAVKIEPPLFCVFHFAPILKIIVNECFDEMKHGFNIVHSLNVLQFNYEKGGKVQAATD